MEAVNEVVIVSAFGRGIWLASELATHGWKVALVDTTEALGPWKPEDWEGPFGVFHSDHLRPSQLTRLGEDDPLVPSGRGFTIWLESGPLELRSPLTRFLLEKHQVCREAEDYLLRFNLHQPGLVGSERRVLRRMNFSKTWLAGLAHQIGGTVFRENAQALESGLPLRLFSAHSIRQATREGFDKALKLCRDRGVEVYSKARIEDVRVDGKQMETIEISGERSGAIRGQAFVWMLSSEESAMFPRSVGQNLFPGGVVSASWSWQRFRFDLKSNFATEVMPAHLCLIEDLNLPWTHSNLLLMQKTKVAGSERASYDVWARLPARHRFERVYLEKIGEQIAALLKRRVPGSAPACASLPVESVNDQESAGPPRFPVFDQDDLDGLLTFKSTNVFFDGPEAWPTLDWVGQMVSQGSLLARLEKLKAAWEAAKAKGVEA